ncbi:MAG: hypothetical protein WEA58_08420 [Balneolaceae bacterium]
MEKVIIKQDSRINSVLNFLFAGFATFGALVLAGFLYDYFTEQLGEQWFHSFLIGGIYFMGGIGYLLGFFKFQPEVIVDENGIHSSKTHWDQSFKWEKLKKVSLDKKSIQVQYTDTGAFDTLKLPFMLRWGNMAKLREALLEGCKIHNIDLD